MVTGVTHHFAKRALLTKQRHHFIPNPFKSLWRRYTFLYQRSLNFTGNSFATCNQTANFST